MNLLRWFSKIHVFYISRRLKNIPIFEKKQVKKNTHVKFTKVKIKNRSYFSYKIWSQTIKLFRAFSMTTVFFSHNFKFRRSKKITNFIKSFQAKITVV